MGESHPRCLWCGRLLRRWYDVEGKFGYLGEGLVCSLRHAYYVVRAASAQPASRFVIESAVRVARDGGGS